MTSPPMDDPPAVGRAAGNAATQRGLVRHAAAPPALAQGDADLGADEAGAQRWLSMVMVYPCVHPSYDQNCWFPHEIHGHNLGPPWLQLVGKIVMNYLADNLNKW